jgi:hypothetical protein
MRPHRATQTLSFFRENAPTAINAPSRDRIEVDDAYDHRDSRFVSRIVAPKDARTASRCQKQNGRRGDRTPAAASFGKGIRDGCEKLVAERGPRL